MKYLAVLVRYVGKHEKYIVTLNKDGKFQVFADDGVNVYETENEKLVKEAATLLEKYNKVIEAETEMSLEEFFEKLGDIPLVRLFTPPTENIEKVNEVMSKIEKFTSINFPKKREFAKMLPKIHEILEFLSVKRMIDAKIKEESEVDINDYMKLYFFRTIEGTYVRLVFEVENDIDYLHLISLIMKGDQRLDWDVEEVLDRAKENDIPVTLKTREAITDMKNEFMERLTFLSMN